MAIIKTEIKEAYDTEENWKTHNPLLLSGQLAFSSDKQGQYKIGDSIHPNILAYETIFVPKIEHWLLSL